MDEKRSVVLVGTGFVGMSMAYSFMNTGGIDELILIDIDDKKAEGEAMDISDGLPHVKNHMRIVAGTYKDCADADIVVITAGANQQPKQTRLELAEINTKIMEDITKSIMRSGFDGIIIVASNPVDLMTYVVQKISGLPATKVIGTGTLLDTSRLRFKLSQALNVTPKNVHAYILGEHGDSSFAAWSNSYIGCMKINDFLDDHGINECLLEKIYKEVKEAAYEIIERKKATYYGIGLSLNRLVQAILDDENVILTVSCKQNGEYIDDNIYIGAPAIINRQGIKEIVKLRLEDDEFYKFEKSCHQLLEIINTIINPII